MNYRHNAASGDAIVIVLVIGLVVLVMRLLLSIFGSTHAKS